jgi:hypothetical protein
MEMFLHYKAVIVKKMKRRINGWLGNNEVENNLKAVVVV